MKALFLFLSVIVTASPALAQIQYGTVGVVYFTKDKIIVAADSRGLFLNGNGQPDDCVCKIATPHGKLVFVSSHVIRYNNLGLGDPVQSWSNTEEIHRAYDTASSLYLNGHDRILRTATEWGRAISSKFESAFPWHPEMILDAAREGNGALTQAIIGGLDDKGALTLFVTTIKLQQGISPSAFATTESINCGPKFYCGVGETEVEEEFVNLTSDRAEKEANKWTPPKNSNPEDRDILKTIRLVDLTIQYHGDDVGGRVDAVQMDKDGTVRWFARKENCAKD